MVFNGKGRSSDGAALVFADNDRDASRVANYAVKALFPDGRRMSASRRLMTKNLDHLLSEADQDKLAIGEAHYVLEMGVCPQCGFWGEEWPQPDGCCGYCDYDPLI